ncbi:unnamed protein product, partial [Cladocopium goreaui]
ELRMSPWAEALGTDRPNRPNAQPGQRLWRWPASRGARAASDFRVTSEVPGCEIDPNDLAMLERILPPALCLGRSNFQGLGLRARRSFAPGSDIATENALTWCLPGQSQMGTDKGFSAAQLFPAELLSEPENRRCALTAVLCLLHARQKLVSPKLAAVGVWFRVTSRGPRHWLNGSQRRLLERKVQTVRKLLQEARFKGAAMPLKISDQEILDMELRRIGTGIGQDSVVPLTFAFLNHSCCPN